MTNDDINRYIHTEIMSDHWHVLITADHREKGHGQCECGKFMHKNPNPDYCSDASPRSLLNAVLAKVLMDYGRNVYDDAMEDVLKPIVESANPQWANTRDDAERIANEWAEEIITRSINPTAEQIARACVHAHEAFATQARALFVGNS